MTSSTSQHMIYVKYQDATFRFQEKQGLLCDKQKCNLLCLCTQLKASKVLCYQNAGVSGEIKLVPPTQHTHQLELN